MRRATRDLDRGAPCFGSGGLPPLLWNLSPHHLLRCKYHAVVSPQTAKSYCYTVMWKSRQSRLASRLRSYGETHQGIKTFNKMPTLSPKILHIWLELRSTTFPVPLWKSIQITVNYFFLNLIAILYFSLTWDLERWRCGWYLTQKANPSNLNEKLSPAHCHSTKRNRSSSVRVAQHS